MAAAELALAPRRQRCDRARIADVDEAGRGPLAGPVVAAAEILDPRRRIRGLADSKLLTAQQRERLALLIRARALAFGIGWADRDEIDCLNILEATLLAMRRALDACYPGFALARHKGYGTPAHLEALARRPPSPLHRRSFSPLRRSGDT